MSTLLISFHYILGIVGYTIIGGIVSGFSANKGFNGNELPPHYVMGILWPLSIPIFMIAWLGTCFHKIAKQPFSKIIKPFQKFGKRISTKKPKAIKIPRGAKIETSKQYRELTHIVREYEETLPILERE